MPCITHTHAHTFEHKCTSAPCARMRLQLQALAPLYSDASVLVYDGMQCTGREAIMGHLAAAATANAMRK